MLETIQVFLIIKYNIEFSILSGTNNVSKDNFRFIFTQKVTGTIKDNSIILD